jgi:hypothetical protein
MSKTTETNKEETSLALLVLGGLLDRSTARYFYKRLLTCLHKPTENFLENLFGENVYLKII